MNSQRILIIGELYKPLIPWFHFDEAPQGVPAVYNLYNYLGKSESFKFKALMVSPLVSRKKRFQNGSYIKFFRLRIKPYYLWKIICLIYLFIKTIRELKKQEYDYVYGLSTYALIAAIAGKITKVPSVGRIFGTILTNPVKEKKWLKIYMRFFFDWLAIKIPCDVVIATKDGTQYDWVSQQLGGTGNIHLLYNGIQEGKKKKLLQYNTVKKLNSATTIKICYIARLEYYKRQHLAIQLIQKLVTDHPNFHLSIVGSGSQLNQLKQLTIDFALTKYVAFIPEMSHNKLIDFIESQDIALFLYEGGNLGNTLWECGLGGRLIITTTSGGTDEVIKDEINGLVVDDVLNIPELIYEKLLPIIDNPIVQNLTEKCRDDLQKKIYSWDKRFDKEFLELIPLQLSF